MALVQPLDVVRMRRCLIRLLLWTMGRGGGGGGGGGGGAVAELYDSSDDADWERACSFRCIARACRGK